MSKFLASGGLSLPPIPPVGKTLKTESERAASYITSFSHFIHELLRSFYSYYLLAKMIWKQLFPNNAMAWA